MESRTMSQASRAGWLVGAICGVLTWGHPFTALLILVLMPHRRRQYHRRLPTHANDNDN
jgi:hypothetical protein